MYAKRESIMQSESECDVFWSWIFGIFDRKNIAKVISNVIRFMDSYVYCRKKAEQHSYYVDSKVQNCKFVYAESRIKIT